MNDLIVKNFKGKRIYNFVWKNRACWIAIQIAEFLGYKEPSKTVTYCMKVEEYEKGVDYDILIGEELKIFKKVAVEELKFLKFAPKLMIFYEEGLYGFLQYSEMPIGVKFRKWIRQDILPELKKTNNELSIQENIQSENKIIKEDIIGILDEKIKTPKDKLTLETKNMINKIKDSVSNESGFDVDKFQRMRVTLEALKFFKPILDEITDNTLYKFEFLKDICTEAGIVLPIYVDGDNIL